MDSYLNLDRRTEFNLKDREQNQSSFLEELTSNFPHAVLPGPLGYLLGQWDRVDTDTSMEERVWLFVLS